MREGVNPELGMAILRIVLAVTFITHGAHRIFVTGVGGTVEFFAGLGIPLAGVAAWFITFLEFGGGIALLLGWMTSALSVLFIAHMMTGIVLVHSAEGWFVVGPGTGGAELNVVLVAGLLALILVGPGSGALDNRRADPDEELERQAEIDRELPGRPAGSGGPPPESDG